MVVGFSPFCSWISLLPSNVHTDLTVRPSTVSSSNSSPSLNLIVVFLKVDKVLNVYSSPFFTSSTVGEMLLPSLRRTIPTPRAFM
uniref:Putative secreted protein n=1 Tax=Anopheles darlingi TaxID=43151 RepID=A0A2M4DH30_ANODA